MTGDCDISVPFKFDTSNGVRPTWDEVWMETAHAISRRSLCSRAQVGAVIASATNRIVATGHNGPSARFDHRDQTCDQWCQRAINNERSTSYDNCPSLHAEANALLAADRSLWQGGVIFVTSGVCGDCAKLISNSGIVRVVVATEPVDRSYRQLDQSYAGLRDLGICVDLV